MLIVKLILVIAISNNLNSKCMSLAYIVIVSEIQNRLILSDDSRFIFIISNV